MNESDFTSMTPAALQRYMDTHKEKTYLLLDVRQPDEYEEGHIPGARLMPIMDLVANLYDLPDDRDLIFYCRSGGRSMAAAALVIEETITTRQIYNVDGGILAWTGQMLSGYPKVRLFDKAMSPSELLLTAINLEKGAMRFYSHVTRRFSTLQVSKAFSHLIDAEIAHAKAVYNIWQSMEKEPPSFESLFEKMDGNILEGGSQLTDMLKLVMAMGENLCMDLVELALHVEYSAFDLYKAMADRTDIPNARDAFLSIAQAEKSHMKILIEATGLCGNQ